MMIGRPMLILVSMLALVALPVFPQSPEEVDYTFALVTKVSKDRRQVTANVLSGGTVRETTLIPTDAILDNPIWKKLEICHSLRMQGTQTPEGYRIASIRNLDAGMLPMALQGIAGDCLTKKALEFAPAID